MSSVRRRIIGLGTAALVAAALPFAAAATPAGPINRLSRLHVVRGAQPRIADAGDRQVLLRGANDNQLGDYYQADPAVPSTVPLTEADFAQMATLGFDAVRLIACRSDAEDGVTVRTKDGVARLTEA